MKNFVVTVLISICTTITHAEPALLSLSTGVDYSSGKYGQTESTDITCVPFTGKYEKDRLTLKLTVPWIQIVGTGVVTGSATNFVVVNNTNKTRSKESGLGDVVSSATYTAIELPEQQIIVDVTGKIKFGTASHSRGLGTGENDYSLESDAYKSFSKVTLMGTLGYRFFGDPPEINLNNVWYGSLGLAYRLSERNSAGAYIDLRQPTTSTGTNLREYTVYFTHKFNPNYKLQSYLVHGDTRSSADWGGGLMLGYTW